MADYLISRWLVFNLLGISMGVWLLFHFWKEKNIIRAFARSLIRDLKDPTQQVLALCGGIYEFGANLPPNCHGDPHFIPLGGLSALGATPATVLSKGGCCSGLTRLALVSLHSLGYAAWQITLYHSSGKAQHCLLEVSVGNPQHMLIDPTYGFYYLNDGGVPLNFSSLREGQRPSFACLPGSTQNKYPQNDYYNFDYKNTKTANWTMSRLRKASYLLLYCVTMGGVDHVKQPSILEWPQLILVCCLCGILLLINSFVVIF